MLLTNAAVSKITFQPRQQPLIATGVEFVHDKRTFSASVSKEVILCAGLFVIFLIETRLVTSIKVPSRRLKYWNYQVSMA